MSSTPRRPAPPTRRSRAADSAPRHLRQRTDLAQEGHGVGQLPLLHDPTAFAAADRDPSERHVPPGRTGAHQVAVVPAPDGAPGRDIVAVGELVIDRNPQAAQRPAIPLDHLLEAVDALHLLWM